MKTSGIFMIGLLVISGVIVFGMTTPAQAQTVEEITIGVVQFKSEFDPTSVKLAKNTTYTITFVNDDGAGAKHNLWIDLDGDVSASTADKGDDDDILIGAPNNSDESAGGPDKSWSYNWTTPDKDIDITYYCGTTGHFADGMKGTFVIGEGSPEKAPGFGLFVAFTSLFVVATVARRMKKI